MPRGEQDDYLSTLNYSDIIILDELEPGSPDIEYVEERVVRYVDVEESDEQEVKIIDKIKDTTAGNWGPQERRHSGSQGPAGHEGRETYLQGGGCYRVNGPN